MMRNILILNIKTHIRPNIPLKFIPESVLKLGLKSMLTKEDICKSKFLFLFETTYTQLQVTEGEENVNFCFQESDVIYATGRVLLRLHERSVFRRKKVTTNFLGLCEYLFPGIICHICNRDRDDMREVFLKKKVITHFLGFLASTSSATSLVIGVISIGCC